MKNLKVNKKNDHLDLYIFAHAEFKYISYDHYFMWQIESEKMGSLACLSGCGKHHSSSNNINFNNDRQDS